MDCSIHRLSFTLKSLVIALGCYLFGIIALRFGAEWTCHHDAKRCKRHVKDNIMMCKHHEVRWQTKYLQLMSFRFLATCQFYFLLLYSVVYTNNTVARLSFYHKTGTPSPRDIHFRNSFSCHLQLFIMDRPSSFWPAVTQPLLLNWCVILFSF